MSGTGRKSTSSSSGGSSRRGGGRASTGSAGNTSRRGRSPTKGTSGPRKSTTSVPAAAATDVTSGSRPVTGRRSLVQPQPPAVANDSLVSEGSDNRTGADLTTPPRGRPSAAAAPADDTQLLVRARRSLSQPPPNSTIRRQLRAAIGGTPLHPSASTPKRQLPTAATPGTGGLVSTPHRGRPSGVDPTPASVGRSGGSAITSEVRRRRRQNRESMLTERSGDASFHALAALAGGGTPALPDYARQSSLATGQASANRSRRGLIGRRSRTKGIAGWGGGRVESPFDLLSKLARAPGFYQQASEQSVLAERALQQRDESQEAAATPRSESMAGNRSTIASRRATTSTVLQPGESVPGELTRDESDMDLIDDGSFTRRTIPEMSAMDESDAGLALRHQRSSASGFGDPSRRDLFNQLQATPDKSRVSVSRASLIADLSGASVNAAARRQETSEMMLEKTMDMDITNVYAGENDDLVMSRLADVTRESLFGGYQQEPSRRDSVGRDEPPAQRIERDLDDLLENDLTRSDVFEEEDVARR